MDYSRYANAGGAMVTALQVDFGHDESALVELCGECTVSERCGHEKVYGVQMSGVELAQTA